MSRAAVGLAPPSPLWVFEENFRLLASLLPSLEEGGRALFSSSERGQSLEVRLLERSRYTDTLSLTRAFAGDRRLLPDLSMKVRAYFDANVAEVLAYQDCHRIPPRYRVVGSGRFNRDEKLQVNQLLRELLRNCLARDFRLQSDPDFTPV